MFIGKLIGRLNPQSIVDLAFRVRPDGEYIIFQDQRLTRRQVFAHVKALAAGLQSLEIGKGDRVAILLLGCPEAVFAVFLPSILGNINVPLNPLLGEHELRHILADCGAKAVITTSNWYGQDYAATLARLSPDLPSLRYVIVRDAADTRHPGDGDRCMFWPLKDVMALGEPLQRVRLSAEDTVLISYTSGTTGWPKGVVHTQGRYWGLAVRAVNPRLNIRLLRCLLLPFPPYHYAGLLGIVATLLAGGRVILMERFNPRKMLEYIQTEKVSQVAASPTMYRWLLRTPGQEGYDLSSVKRVTLSTEPCSPDLARALHERLGCHLENMYGTTESRMISWTGPGDSWEQVGETVGQPAPGVRIRIVDDEQRPLSVGERGEIAVQTSQMMMGYYRDPEMTAQVLDADGWFYTGDIGMLDGDGYLRLVDRKKDMIIRAGENIYPAEIERYLESHPLIRRAGVVGVPSPIGGEEAWAYLELQPGATLTVKEVLNFCRGQIAPFKIPAQVRFEERLPATATGKVQKFKLRRMAAA